MKRMLLIGLVALAGCGSSRPSPQAREAAHCRAENVRWAAQYSALTPAGLSPAKIRRLAAELDQACR